MTVEVLNTARCGDKQRRISPESWATALLYCCSTQDRDGLHPHEGARPGPTMTPLLSARQLSDYGFNRNGALCARRGVAQFCAMEGARPSPFCLELLTLYEAGEISGAEMRKRMLERRGAELVGSVPYSRYGRPPQAVAKV